MPRKPKRTSFYAPVPPTPIIYDSYIKRELSFTSYLSLVLYATLSPSSASLPPSTDPIFTALPEGLSLSTILMSRPFPPIPQSILTSTTEPPFGLFRHPTAAPLFPPFRLAILSVDPRLLDLMRERTARLGFPSLADYLRHVYGVEPAHRRAAPDIYGIPASPGSPPPGEPTYISLSVRLPLADFSALVRRAGAEGLSISEYVASVLTSAPSPVLQAANQCEANHDAA